MVMLDFGVLVLRFFLLDVLLVFLLHQLVFVFRRIVAHKDDETSFELSATVPIAVMGLIQRAVWYPGVQFRSRE
jgi:hypothetical protein